MKTVIKFTDGSTVEYANLAPSVDIEGQSVALVDADYRIAQDIPFDQIVTVTYMPNEAA